MIEYTPYGCGMDCGQVLEGRRDGKAMAIQPEDFDVPVVDYAFSDISTPRSLLDQMASAGGFTATKLATARDILLEMKKQVDAVNGDSSKV